MIQEDRTKPLPFASPALAGDGSVMRRNPPRPRLGGGATPPEEGISRNQIFRPACPSTGPPCPPAKFSARPPAGREL